VSLPPYPHYDKLYSRFVRPRHKRLSYAQTALVFHEAGFRGEALVEMVATSRPESAGDPQAFLAYVQLPRNPVKRAAFLVAIAALKPAGIGVIKFRSIVKKLGGKVVDVDIGLGQVKWWWAQETYSMQDLTDPLTNAKLCLGKWKASGFKPWAANTAGLHVKFMEPARAACRHLELI
jgi:hypothetical protein